MRRNITTRTAWTKSSSGLAWSWPLHQTHRILVKRACGKKALLLPCLFLCLRLPPREGGERANTNCQQNSIIPWSRKTTTCRRWAGRARFASPRLVDAVAKFAHVSDSLGGNVLNRNFLRDRWGFSWCGLTFFKVASFCVYSYEWIKTLQFRSMM